MERETPPSPRHDEALCTLLDVIGRSVIAIGKALLEYAKARRVGAHT